MAWSWCRRRRRGRWPGPHRGPAGGGAQSPRAWPAHVPFPVEPDRVPSPGGWAVPPGVRPGWNWTPPPGIVPRPERAPRWVRWWYRSPLIDRYAHPWMWWHGAWDVVPPAARAPGSGGAAGVREPRRPVAPSGTGAAPPPQEPDTPPASTASAAPDL